MLKLFLHALSHATWAAWIATHAPVARQMARRFVAGETAEEAIAAIRLLNQNRITATVDYLGEHVTTAADADRAADGYLTMFDKIAGSGTRANISLKLTQLGLDLDEQLCRELMRRLLRRAIETNIFIRIDMESSRYTDRTLAICRQLNREAGLGRVGIVIQASLYRSDEDLQQLIAEQIRIRLCKGAYLEPPDIAYSRKRDVDANYLHLTQRLLKSSTSGLYHAIATHDETMITAAIDFATHHGVRSDQFEFQMLYGIRRKLQRQLVKNGFRVRVYVPYGTEWYPYLMRRLAERPANLWFFLSQLFRR